MSSWQTNFATWVVRRRVKPALADMSDIASVRRVFDKPLPSPRGVAYTPASVGGVPGEWVQVASGQRGTPAGTLLYIHGGGFVGCSPATHRPITAAFARQGFRVFAVDYRLAPEHPSPAALRDVQACWHALANEHAANMAAAPGRLVVAGDSAGGNLALALMLSLRDAGQRLPDAAALFSPATDLTGGSASVLDNAERDAMFNGAGLEHLARAYLAGLDPAQPLVSPLLGDLHGLPPLLLHVGEDECLRDDSLRLAQKARAAGVRVQLQVWATVPHVWQLMAWLPEARRSLALAADFLRQAQPLPAPGALAADGQPVPHDTLDALVVGAGLSGIGMAAHLQRECPELRHAVLEARPRIGGTWDLFRYPGVRSDSDMHTLGYGFKPWVGSQALADGPSIRGYIEATARERGIDLQVRHGHRVLRADWCSDQARWHVDVEVTPPNGPPEVQRIATRFLLMCSGYYRYSQGHRPHWPGEDRFAGQWVHPQAWPEGLDCRGKRVVVIGSGATAVTLVPALAAQGAQVTMLQRSPSYVVTLPGQDGIAERLKRWLPPMLAYRLVRSKNILAGLLLFRLARRWPEATKKRLVGLARQQLAGSGCDATTHFSPRYNPWDQRVCAVPDGDLFAAIRSGQATVVTDQIAQFTPQGISLQSGQVLPADIVVTATGLELNLLGDVALSLDGVPLVPGQTMAYKGMMFSGVPNLVQTFGYTNAAWTLKADLTARFTCRLMRLMQRRGWASATPRRDPSVGEQPFLDFSSGYIARALAWLPKQGDRKPWRLYQNYLLDWLTLRLGRVDDGHLRFAAAPSAAATRPVDRPVPAAARQGPVAGGADGPA